jgi:hypothetical protein
MCGKIIEMWIFQGTPIPEITTFLHRPLIKPKPQHLQEPGFPTKEELAEQQGFIACPGNRSRVW